MNGSHVANGSSVALLAICAILSACAHQSPEHKATRDAITEAVTMPGVLFVIHAPSTGCPQGWQYLPHAFLERDGKPHDGCSHGSGRQGGTIDYLLPGESFPGVTTIWALGGAPGATS